MAEWAHYSLPSVEWTEAIANVGGVPPLFKNTDIPSRRAMVNELIRKRVEDADKATLIGIKIEEKRIRVSKPEGDIPIRIYTPESKNSEETFSVLLDLHGGGYCLGSLDTDEVKCRVTSQKHRIVIVNVDYRLAPEFPWPVGINDSYDALKWVVEHTTELRVDVTKGLIISGLSAGAGFTCVISQRARVDSELKGKITGQILQIPPTCNAGPDGYPEKFRHKLLSYEQNKGDPILNTDNIRMFTEAYNASPATNVEASPLLAESFVDLPAAYIQVAGGDPLRDEGLCYAERLQEDGIPVKLDIYPGVPHGFASYFPNLKISQKWRDDYDEGLKSLLQRTSQSS